MLLLSTEVVTFALDLLSNIMAILSQYLLSTTP
jgi:hypothetical protein